MDTLVSIGIITYKRPLGLKKTLMSISNQTYQNLEIIVSDDNPEGSENEPIVKEFQEGDRRIRYIKMPRNSGMNENFRNALTHANGAYFMWAADDDYWTEDYIENCFSALKNNPKAILCTTQTTFMDALYQETEVSQENIDTQGLEKKERFSKYFLNSQICNHGFYGLFKTDYLRKAYFPNYVSNDRLLLLELSLQGEFIQLPCKGFYYNKSGNSSGIVAYLRAIKLNSRLLRKAPHIGFILFHYRAILFRWKKIRFGQRIKYLRILHNLLREVGYYYKAKHQLKNLIGIR